MFIDLLSLAWGYAAPWLAYIVAALLIALPWLILAIPGAGPVIGPVINKVITWRPPIPLNWLLAIAVFAWLNSQGYIMRKVNEATTQFVAGEKLAAKDAVIAKMQVDLSIENRLRGDAERRAAEAQAKDTADAIATQKRIASDKCISGKCAVWTQEDIQWLSGKH